eukprot:2418076-Ditylum_brightwellii.AAC.1
MMRTRANAMAKNTAKEKAENRNKNKTQEAKARTDTKEKTTKKKEVCGLDKAAAAIESTAKTNVVPSPCRC